MSHKDWYPNKLELSIWLQAMENVTKHKRDRIANSQIDNVAIIPRYHDQKKDNIELLNHNHYKELLLGDFSNIDRNSVKKIDQGSYKIDLIVDLHGYTTEQAFDLVRNCIAKSWSENYRLLLFITGRGKRNTESATINSLFLKWMSSSQIRPYILRVSIADRKHGGDGAFYVLLKRDRISKRST